MSFSIAVDFDGTIADHIFPDIGYELPGAVEWLKRWKEAGATLILWTMRSDHYLEDALAWCRKRGVDFDYANTRPQAWTNSPKVYAHVYVDDAAYRCPLKENPRAGGRPYVDWATVGPGVLAMIEEYK